MPLFLALLKGGSLSVLPPPCPQGFALLQCRAWLHLGKRRLREHYMHAVEEKLVSCLQGKCSHTFLSFTQYNLVFVPSFPWWVVLFGFKKRRTAKKTIPRAYFCRMDPLMTSSSSKSASLAIKSSLFPVLSTPMKSRCSTESYERKKNQIKPVVLFA